jgi:hypothetical protein
MKLVKRFLLMQIVPQLHRCGYERRRVLHMQDA